MADNKRLLNKELTKEDLRRMAENFAKRMKDKHESKHGGQMVFWYNK